MADVAAEEVAGAWPAGRAQAVGRASQHLSGAKYDMHEDPDGEWGDAWYYDDQLIYVQKKFVAIPNASVTEDDRRRPRLRPHADDHDRHHLRRHAHGLLGP